MCHSAIYLKVHLKCRRKDTTWRLNVGILNNKSVVEQIRADIRTYLEENNNGETDPAILWDALKAVIRGKFIAITSNLKRERIKQYKIYIAELRHLEQKQKGKGNVETKIKQRMSEVKKEMNNLLQCETETKARYLKQSYDESGPKTNEIVSKTFTETTGRNYSQSNTRPKNKPAQI